MGVQVDMRLRFLAVLALVQAGVGWCTEDGRGYSGIMSLYMTSRELITLLYGLI